MAKALLSTNTADISFMALIGGITFYRSLKHVYRMDYMKKQFEKTDAFGEPVNIDEATEALVNRVLRRRNLDPYDEASTQFFYSFTKAPVRIGSLQFRGGAYIGLPFFTSYKNIDDVINSETLIIQGKTSSENYQIDWEDPLAVDMAKNLVLSEKAKMFLIAREIFNVSSWAPLVESGLGLVSGVLGYGVYRINYYRARMLGIPGHGFFLTLAALVGSYIYTTAQDNYTWALQNKANKQAAMLGSEYAEGGVELYQSILNGNKIMRELASAEDYYTSEGDVQYPWYRQPFVPISVQRNNVGKILLDLRSGTVEPTVYPDKTYKTLRLGRPNQW